MSLALPEPLATYFAKENQPGSGDVAELFAVDAVVHDEHHTHRGHDAIAAWKAQAKRKYHYRSEPLRLAPDGDRFVVTARVEGDFPGSPVELAYAFTVADGRIASLEIL